MISLRKPPPCITFKQVELVANKLKEEGKSVSINAVREQLGSGSNSTISKFLKQLSDCEMCSLPPDDYSAKYPERLRIVIQETYSELVDAAKAVSEKRNLEIQEVEVRLRARWAIHIKERIKLNRALEIEKQTSSSLSTELKKLSERSARDHELILSLTERAVRSESKVEHLQVLNEGLIKRHATISKNFERLEEHSRQHHHVESQMHLLKVAKLEQDLMNCQNRIIELARELAGVEKKDSAR